MLQLIHISEGLRMFKRSLMISAKGYKRYEGSAEQILRQIIDNCWNEKKEYFQVSKGNYTNFYCRDFGIVTIPLIELGYKDKVIKTLEYAMNCYYKHGKITQVISPNGTPFEFPSFAADSLPFLLFSLNRAKANQLISKYKEFLNQEIRRYYKIVFDEKTNLVKKDPHISGMKDYALRISPCYHNCMLAMLKNEIEIAKLDNPFKKYDFNKLIKENFWKNTHFIDDLSGNDTITGDANVFPFWCNVFDAKKDRKMLCLVIKKMQENALDTPLPLRYYHKKIKEHDMIWINKLSKDWEHDTVWLHLGMCYLDIVKKADKKLLKKYLFSLKEWVEKNGNMYEVLEPNGKPLKSFFYKADDGMIWSAILLNHLLNNK